MSEEKLPAVGFHNILQRQEIAHRMVNHRRRVLQVQTKKPNPATNEPTTLSFKTILDQNPKRTYFLENKYTEIERENRVLFEKITKISKHKKKSPSTLERMRSLNITYRKRQIQEIECENAKLYNRLLQQKPFISFRDTDREFEENKRMANRLSKKNKYPIEDYY